MAAGDVALAFDVPQPTVTRTSAVTTDHAVNAGDANWSFRVVGVSDTSTIAGGEGLVITVEGDAVEGMQRECRIVRTVGTHATADVKVLVPVGGLTRVPRDGDELVIRDANSSNRIIFGGIVDEPVVRFLGGDDLLDIKLPAIGWGSRFNQVTLTQDQGIEIADSTRRRSRCRPSSATSLAKDSRRETYL